MRVINTVSEFRAARAGLGDLGLVPTLGYLHDGHLSLGARAKADDQSVAVSILARLIDNLVLGA
jgi:pantoate--beta-alanine ligase